MTRVVRYYAWKLANYVMSCLEFAMQALLSLHPHKFYNVKWKGSRKIDNVVKKQKKK